MGDPRGARGLDSTNAGIGLRISAQRTLGFSLLGSTVLTHTQDASGLSHGDVMTK